jgi:hypothetical protein
MVSISNFEKDLEELFKEQMLNDNDLCAKVWSALANVDWINIDGTEYSCSFRYAGSLIARIIGRGTYLDWYAKGAYGVVDEYIAEALQRRGWRYEVIYE